MQVEGCAEVEAIGRVAGTWLGSDVGTCVRNLRSMLANSLACRCGASMRE